VVAPDGTKLSKRKHGAVVSVTTYRDAGFLPSAFVNFLCLLGLVAKERSRVPLDRRVDRPLHSRRRQPRQRSNQFQRCRSFRPKAVWLNAEHIRALPVDQLSECLAPFFKQAGFNVSPEKTLAVAPLIRERIKLLGDALQPPLLLSAWSSRPTIPPS